MLPTTTTQQLAIGFYEGLLNKQAQQVDTVGNIERQPQCLFPPKSFCTCMVISSGSLQIAIGDREVPLIKMARWNKSILEALATGEVSRRDTYYQAILV